jgi:hypothetical protein
MRDKFSDVTNGEFDVHVLEICGNHNNAGAQVSQRHCDFTLTTV